jgi:hypothetical protein
MATSAAGCWTNNLNFGVIDKSTKNGDSRTLGICSVRLDSLVASRLKFLSSFILHRVSKVYITEDLRSAQIDAANVILLPFRSLTLNWLHLQYKVVLK